MKQKKILITLVSFISLLSLVSCSNNDTAISTSERVYFPIAHCDAVYKGFKRASISKYEGDTFNNQDLNDNLIFWDYNNTYHLKTNTNYIINMSNFNPSELFTSNDFDDEDVDDIPIGSPVAAPVSYSYGSISYKHNFAISITPHLKNKELNIDGWFNLSCDKEMADIIEFNSTDVIVEGVTELFYILVVFEN